MPPLSVPQARVLVHDVGQSWRGPDTAALVCAASHSEGTGAVASLALSRQASHPSCTRRL